MRIDLNGASTVTDAGTLAVLLDEQGFDAASVATALDGLFVARSARAATVLRDGAKVEVLSPMQGG
ncbi:sulfur carrier protein ThiS [Pararhodobacter sp. CCB-MM2]|uniref:sulfur carrier protein ThiS n=1 Tax=Pararhodobacter sp. CCB-MM2 TaxID=1786003 RepID=UPI000830CC92|nr:sulfur carrier protein ThiS [Pararhodobacter sp. CCB-MM2]